jgi:K+-transporting ATPase ATPase C chain
MTSPTHPMSPFTKLARPVLVSAIFFMLLTGLAYPLLTTLVANLLFPFQAQGSLIEREGRIIGSAVIGQDFAGSGYWHPRPSATVATDPADSGKTVSMPYNAGLSGASNQGPTNRKLLDEVKARVDAYRAGSGLAVDAPVPVDAVTASGSGLDPHISIANARIQARRIARQRQLPQQELMRLVDEHTASRVFGLLGEPRINVLELNLALDALAARSSTSGPLEASEK